MISSVETASASIDSLNVLNNRLHVEGDSFEEGFYKLQCLISSIEIDHSNAEEVTEAVMKDLPGVQEHAAALDGQPVLGTRHSAYYHRGNERPEETVWDPFSNFLFRGILRGVEVIMPPQEPCSGSQLTLVVDRGLSSSDQDIRALFCDTSSDFSMYKRIWVPSDGLQFNIDCLYIHNAIQRVQDKRIRKA